MPDTALKTALKPTDTLALGLMTFALFLGAGNLIFPPQVGQQAGTDFWPAALGFLTTGVGLPVLGIVAVAVAGGGLDRILSPIPKAAATLFGLCIYLSIGPMFAMPRTATVAYNMGAAPFLEDPSAYVQPLYVGVFFLIAVSLSLMPGRLVDVVGKWITPILIALLAILAGATLLFPQGDFGLPSPDWHRSPFAKGVQSGYLTMDMLASMVFGILITNAIRNKGIEAPARITRYTLSAGAIAGVCLAAVYLPLAFMGATSHEVAPNAESGALIPAYVDALLGPTGGIILAVVITLACLTTAIGLLTACGEYFNRLIPAVPYRVIIVALGISGIAVALQGLGTLIQVSVPVLSALYPLAIVVIALSLIRPWLSHPARMFNAALAITLPFGVLEGLHAAGKLSTLGLASMYEALPLSDDQTVWLLPALIGIGLGLALQKRA
ncbi:branched-chain amino acid transport system II carrier protein [Larsenimonas salina]|uniref:branched-chain amino acid transport system II carrier protein n=1 Tax=Larsenimonas salina TaxID=1295565 RepID=UPI002073523A|nr:branched-chain amino acid transport system II carrier protein [Larsenimonas salina]MCM5704784.1 branched-chain amino acid transport system II carrier protein [Larsenimonas salina]